MHELGTLHDDIDKPNPDVIYDLYKLSAPSNGDNSSNAQDGF